jgi:hypothetical protein
MSYLRGDSPALIEFFHWIHVGQESYAYMLSLDAWSYIESRPGRAWTVSMLTHFSAILDLVQGNLRPHWSLSCSYSEITSKELASRARITTDIRAIMTI